MSAGLAQAISAIIMALFTFIGSIFGIIENMPEYEMPIYGFEQKAEATDLRIMSFNIRCLGVGTDTWQDRIGIVSQTMLMSEADSFGIQEGTPEWMATLKDTVGEKYAFVGQGRDGLDKGEYSAIFYLKDKYTVVDSGTFWLSETPDEMSKGWDASMNRICTWAILKNKSTGEQYVHMNAHFDHIGSIAQSNSAKLIVEKAKAYGDLPVVFTADMNVREGSGAYNTMVESNFFKDSKYEAADTMDYLTYHDTKPKNNEGHILDYVMGNSKLTATQYRVVTEGVDGRYVSDHFPIYADFVINE